MDNRRSVLFRNLGGDKEITKLLHEELNRIGIFPHMMSLVNYPNGEFRGFVIFFFVHESEAERTVHMMNNTMFLRRLLQAEVIRNWNLPPINTSMEPSRDREQTEGLSKTISDFARSPANNFIFSVIVDEMSRQKIKYFASQNNLKYMTERVVNIIPPMPGAPRIRPSLRPVVYK